MKKIAILGSTGSIGQNTLKVVRHLAGQVRVLGIAAKENIELLEQQAREFHPEIIAVYNEQKANELKKRLPQFKVVGGMEGVEAVATLSSSEIVVSAMTGAIGLQPTIAAIRSGKDIALANKEVLVTAGEWVMELVRRYQVSMIPVDSEHSAIFQCLQGNRDSAIRRLILTASGGPFRNKTEKELEAVTLDESLCHPNFAMGPKVTIDSSTLMNKGLEMIEAHWLFNIPCEQIDVVIHPQQIIHSMVEYVDGSILSQMSEPTMILPIQYALTYPDRASGLLPPFDFIKNRMLEFALPDRQKFVCLDLAYQALRGGKSLPCYLNAANEVLVRRFLNRQISWIEIGRKLEGLMSRHLPQPVASLDDIAAIDSQARFEAEKG